MAKLYVGNLSFDVTDDGLQLLFSSKGFQVASARVIRDTESGRSRGFGFGRGGFSGGRGGPHGGNRHSGGRGRGRF